jgi:anti-sigma factor RsiW
MDCREAERLADLDVDGEVQPSERGPLLAHLDACAPCRRRASGRAWFTAGLKAKLSEARSDTEAPVGLKSRIQGRLREEDQRRGFPWGRALPATMVVGALAIVSWAWPTERAFDPEEAVARHSRNLPPEVLARSREAEVHRLFEKNLAYRVKLPRLPGRDADVRLVGGRLSSIDNRDAALVTYDARGARISLFAYPKPDHLAKPASFEEVEVLGRPLLVGRHRGYNVVAWEEDDLLYSLVSDVDGPELVRLAASHRH